MANTLKEEFTSELKNISHQENITVNFAPVELVNLKVNPTGKFEFDSAPAAQRLLIQKHRLLFRRWFRRAFRRIARVATKVVNVIRKHGPLIGSVVGGVSGAVGGFVVGGPAGAFKGAKAGIKLGRMIGTAAQFVAKACIPKDTLKIRCTKDSVLQATSTAGVNIVAGKLM